jgi:hypothetical protein
VQRRKSEDEPLLEMAAGRPRRRGGPARVEFRLHDREWSGGSKGSAKGTENALSDSLIPLEES